MNGPKCPVCDSMSEFRFEKFANKYWQCPCGFVFIHPRPSHEELAALYHAHGEQYWTSEAMLSFAFSPGKSAREIAFVRRFIQSGKLLDIGCSTGSFVWSAQHSGFDSFGVDISEPAIRAGQQRGLKLSAMDVMKSSPGCNFDVVTLWATLEHLPEPVAHLKRAAEFLRPTGLLFVSVPNYSGITQRLIGRWDRYVGADHLNYFRPRVVVRTLKELGLEIMGSTTYAFNPLNLLADIRSRGRKSLNTDDIEADEKATMTLKRSKWITKAQYLAEGSLRLFSLGDVIAVCARKPSTYVRALRDELRPAGGL